MYTVILIEVASSLLKIPRLIEILRRVPSKWTTTTLAAERHLRPATIKPIIKKILMVQRLGMLLSLLLPPMNTPATTSAPFSETTLCLGRFFETNGHLQILQRLKADQGLTNKHLLEHVAWACWERLLLVTSRRIENFLKAISDPRITGPREVLWEDVLTYGTQSIVERMLMHIPGYPMPAGTTGIEGLGRYTVRE